MKEYDIAFSLGFSCGTSQALRAAGLQFASYPLDWTGSPDILTSVRQVANDFAGWLEAGDLELVDVRHGAGFCTRCYRNKKTKLGYSHEFSDFLPFDECYPKVRKTYDRRVERFVECTTKSRRILVVYMELPIRSRAAEADIVSARRLLMDKFPGAVIDLLYVSVEPGRERPELCELAPGVSVAGYDYRKFDDGEITHFIDWERLVPLLKANFRVVDTRSAEEKRAFATYGKMSGDFRWGPDKSRFRRCLNKHLYKTYRSVERILVERGLVQKEGPLWFVER